jgi:hypothetical protein
MPSVPIEMPSEIVMVLNTTALPFALGCFQRQLIDMHVTGRDHAPGRRDADLRFFEIGVVESHRAQHRAARGAIGAVDYQR